MLKNYGFILVGLIIIIFNLFFSQNLPKNYFALVKNDQKAYANFLINIKKLPEFASYYNLALKMYSQKFSNQVFYEQVKNQENIQKMQTLLIINPHQKNILYNLYLLYQQKGDEKLAQEYLNKAKAIDPGIK